MKRTISVLAIVGLIGCFLPLQLGISLFDLRAADGGWRVWLVLAAFGLPAYAGATAKADILAGLAGLVGFGYLALKFGTDTLKLLTHASSGGILMGVAIIGGLCASVAALATRRE